MEKNCPVCSTLFSFDETGMAKYYRRMKCCNKDCARVLVIANSIESAVRPRGF